MSGSTVGAADASDPMRSDGRASRSSDLTAPLADPLAIEPIGRSLDADVVVPGSKSITNRALVAAALADGTSTLTGVLFADDTEAMLDALGRLGVVLDIDRGREVVVVQGLAGRLPPGPIDLDARLSGTTSRFLLPMLALGAGPYRLDGGAPLRSRPMGDGIDAVRHLGAHVEPVEGGSDRHLPVVVGGGSGVRGGEVTVAGTASSQFLSGLLLAGAAMPAGLTVRVTGGLVSRPYVDMTLRVLAAFGVAARWESEDRLHIAAGGLRAADLHVEPDASAASYFFAAAAICGGRVRVAGLGPDAWQGDVAFVDVLERMGATVTRDADGIEVAVAGPLRGVEVDMGDISDTAQTLAAVAVAAHGPTEVRGIGFIRAKETDRIAAVVTELVRCGIEARATDDGFVIVPGTPAPAVVATYDDHRMAMSFALLGLRWPGIRIADPGCVAKTFPGYWRALDGLRQPATGR